MGAGIASDVALMGTVKCEIGGVGFRLMKKWTVWRDACSRDDSIRPYYDHHEGCELK